MMNIRRKYTLFMMNIRRKYTLFRTNNQANLTLFRTNATKSEARPLPLSSREGSDMQCIYIVAEVSGLRSNQRPLP